APGYLSCGAMADAPQPKPAELPLPGGQAGATVRLHPLLCGEATWPEAWPHREDGRLARPHAFGIGVAREQWLELPIVAFLVEHPGAGPILIDTGLSPAFAENPGRDIGRALTRAGVAKTMKMEPSQVVPELLRSRGIDPGDVRLVVMTHLHYDHASGMRQFPDATFVLSEREWKAVQTPLRVLHGYVKSHYHHPFDYRTLDFEGAAADSHATFGRAVDLLGDGSIRALYTPGHTQGHMSILLRTAGREILVAGDAAYTRHTLGTGHKPALMEDEHLFARSLREIQLYAAQAPDALIIPGHDMGAWRELDPVYG
ncbi:MAG: N-acyl homoserine lactone hydrolase, partial [Thermoleophilaceae bacterium]|nr:N-acyl homoserine lactone hydrolase [Thermoleophilaceae bacterium]